MTLLSARSILPPKDLLPVCRCCGISEYYISKLPLSCRANSIGPISQFGAPFDSDRCEMEKSSLRTTDLVHYLSRQKRQTTMRQNCGCTRFRERQEGGAVENSG